MQEQKKVIISGASDGLVLALLEAIDSNHFAVERLVRHEHPTIERSAGIPKRER